MPNAVATCHHNSFLYVKILLPGVIGIAPVFDMSPYLQVTNLMMIAMLM